MNSRSFKLKMFHFSLFWITQSTSLKLYDERHHQFKQLICFIFRDIKDYYETPWTDCDGHFDIILNGYLLVGFESGWYKKRKDRYFRFFFYKEPTKLGAADGTYFQ